MDDQEHVACSHRIDKSIEKRKLIIDCKECEKDYDFDECLPGLILALEGTYKIDSIVVSGHVEKEFKDKHVDILLKIRDIADKIENFSSRKVADEGCEDCEFWPPSYYSQLKGRFISDPGCIYGEITSLKKKSRSIEDCTGCEEDLKEELRMIGKDALELKSDVFTEGFGIIG